MKPQYTCLIVALTLAVLPGQAFSNNRNDSGFERELLRSYLTEVQKSTALEIEREVARYNLQVEIYKDSQQKWWMNFAEKERAKGVQEYWQAYHHGQKIAQDLVAQAKGTHYCDFLKKNFEAVLPAYSPEILLEAARRGAIARHPECYVASTDVWYAEMRAVVKTLREKIMQYREGARFGGNETSAEDLQLRKKIEAYYQTQVSNRMSALLPPLTTALAITDSEMSEIRVQHEYLASRINCAFLRDRNGAVQNCVLGKHSSLLPVDEAAVQRVFLERKSVEPYREHLDLGPTLRAVAVYLRDVSPQDPVARFLGQRLLDLQTQVYRRMNESITTLRTQEERTFHEFKQAVDPCDLGLENHCPTKIERKEFVSAVVTLREKWLDLNRYEVEHALDESRLNTIRTAFNEVMTMARVAILKVRFPKCIQLEYFPADFEAQKIQVTVDLDFEGGSYLLGRSLRESEEIYNELLLPTGI